MMPIQVYDVKGRNMKKVVFGLLAVFVLTALTACSGEKSNPSEVKEETPAPAAAVEPKEEAPKSPGAPGAGGPNPMAALMEVPEGDTPCEQAFNSFKRMSEAMSKMAAGNPNAQQPEMPTKENFIKGCSLLPETMQKCMSLHHATNHKEDCIKAKKEVDPEVMVKANALISPKKK